MPDLVLCVEAEGRVLGEFSLGAGPLVLRLVEPATGRTISTMTFAPGPAATAPIDMKTRSPPNTAGSATLTLGWAGPAHRPRHPTAMPNA